MSQHSQVARHLVTGLGLAILLTASSAAAAPRWGVLTSKQLQTSGVADLLAVRLTELDSLALVERDEVEKVLREQELAALVENAGAAKRLEIGRLVKAQRLLVIDGSWRNERADLRIVIDDTQIGARLFDEKITIAAAEADAVCSAVVGILEDSRQRFPEGLRSAIAIPNFVSKSFGHEHDELQKHFARLLGQSLMRAPRIAIVPLDELQNIRQELALTGGRIERFVPLQVNGEYSIPPNGDPEHPRVTLSVRLSDGAATLETIEYEDVELDGVRDLLMDSVARRVLARVGDAAVQPMSMEAQVQALATRADRFAEYGAFGMAIRLREAILLMDPDNVEQRIALLKNDRATRSRPSLEASYPHVEYLLRQRLVTLPQALALIDMHMTWNYYDPPPPSPLPHLHDEYAYAMALAKLAVNLPCLETGSSLPPGPAPPAKSDELSLELEKSRQYGILLSFAGRLALQPGNEWHRSRKLNDLLEIFRLVPAFDGLFPFLPGIVDSGQFSEKEIEAFCKALRATTKPPQIHFAEFIELSALARFHPDRVNSSHLISFEQLETLRRAFLDRQGIKPQNRYLMTVDDMKKVKARLSRLSRHNVTLKAARTSTVLTPPVFPPPQRETVEEPITIEEITKWNYPRKQQSFPNGMPTPPFPLVCHLFQHSDSIDIVWDEATVYALSRDNEGELVFRELFTADVTPACGFSGRSILRVRDDGENLWVASVNGIVVLSVEGQVLARFTSADGLPEYSCLARELARRQTPELVVTREITQQKTPESAGALPDGEMFKPEPELDGMKGPWHELQSLGYRDSIDPLSQKNGPRAAVLSVFPLEPGRCLAVGRYGADQKTWIALLDWDSATKEKRVRVLHRAERTLAPEQYGNQKLLSDPAQIDLAFNVPWICLYTMPANNATRIAVIGRSHDTRSGWPIGNTPFSSSMPTFPTKACATSATPPTNSICQTRREPGRLATNAPLA